MTEAPTKKLFIVSLLGKPRVKCLAAYNGEVLVIQRMEQIAGLFGSWKASLAEECEKYRESGFDVLVEERQTDHFSQYGTRVLFDEIDPDEKATYLTTALNHYFAITGMGDTGGSRYGNLIMASGLERHILSANMVNVETDEKGRNRYDIDPDRFTGYHRAILIAVLGAQILNPLSDNYLSTFFGLLGTAESTRPNQTLAAIEDYQNRKRGGWLWSE